MTTHNLAQHVDDLLAHSKARELVEACLGIHADAPKSIAQLAEIHGKSRQAIHGRILRHIDNIAQMDLHAGRHLHSTSRLLLDHMETAAIGYADQPANRLHEQTTQDLIEAGIIAPSDVPYVRLALMVQPLDTRHLGEPLRNTDQRIRQIMMPATRPMSDVDIRQRLQYYRVTNRAVRSWPRLSLPAYILRTCGIPADEDGLYPPGDIWAHGFDPSPASAAWAVLALRQAGHAMTMTHLSQAVIRAAAGHIPSRHDALQAIRRHFSQQPELVRSNGRVRLREWSPYRFAAHGLKHTVTQQIIQTLDRYGPIPLATLAATVAAATERDVKYAKYRLRHPKPEDPWRVLPDGKVAPLSAAVSHSQAGTG